MFFAPPEVKSLSRYSDKNAYVDKGTFLFICVLALILHLAVILVSLYTPKEEVDSIPVRTMNIKFSGAGVEGLEMPNVSDMPAIAQETYAKQQMEARNDAHNEARTQAAANDDKNAVIKIITKIVSKKNNSKAVEEQANAKPKQYIRDTSLSSDEKDKEGGNGSGINGSQSGTDIVTRYEQEISLWVTRFKRYPEDAKNQRLQGTAIVRIRVSKDGHIVSSEIDTSSGIKAIDDAALAMVRDADPVPSFPESYHEEEIGLLLPVSFSLQ